MGHMNVPEQNRGECEQVGPAGQRLYDFAGQIIAKHTPCN